MRILSKLVISNLLVSLLLNVSLDCFFFIFTPDSDRGVSGGGGGGELLLSPPHKKLNNLKTVQSLTTKLSDFS